MKTRIITGVPAALLLIWLIFWGSIGMMLIVSMIAGAFAYIEFDRLFFSPGPRFKWILPVLLIELTIFAISQNPMVAGVIFWLSFLCLCAWHVVEADRIGNFPESIRQLSLELLGYVYVVSLLGFLAPLGSVGRDYLLLMFLFVFVGDTAAYVVGGRWGKHRLAPHVSPKKSVEGALSAIASSFLVAGVWLWYFRGNVFHTAFAWKLLVFAPIVSILAQLGDLLESVMKRSRSQKDSGSFLPGHGGLLDRIDGLALVAPVFFFYVIFFLDRSVVGKH